MIIYYTAKFINSVIASCAFLASLLMVILYQIIDFFFKDCFFTKWIGHYICDFFQQTVAGYIVIGTDRKIYLYGDLTDDLQEESSLIISNHQSSVDIPLMTYLLIHLFKQSQNIRFFAKIELSYYPIFGACIRDHIVWLERTNRDKDLNEIKDRVNSLREKIPNLSLILYPEGYKYHLRRSHLIAPSKKFWKDKGMNVATYVLSPRYQGSLQFIQHCEGNVKAIYDITICYREVDAKSRLYGQQKEPTMYKEIRDFDSEDILSYFCSDVSEIHVYFRRIDLKNSIIKDLKCYYDWFQEKEDFLKHVHGTDPKYDVSPFYMKKYVVENDELVAMENTEMNPIRQVSCSKSKFYVYYLIGVLIIISIQMFLGFKRHILFWICLSVIGYTMDYKKTRKNC